MRLLLALLVTLASLVPALAQEDRDRSFLTGLIEDNLSGDAREVRLDGFRGALSSQARFDRLTIADEAGVWLTVEDAVLDWSRTALLGGRLEVSELSAGRIFLERLPGGDGSTELPRLTARDIRLPDLPVSVNIGRIAAERLELGPGVLGQPVTATFSGSLQLADGAGAADIELRRTDGHEGSAVIDASFENGSRQLDLRIEAQEAADGAVANLLGLPGTPSVAFSLIGAAPLADYTAEISLATGGTERLDGQLRLNDLDGGGQGFGLDLSGDITPLLNGDYGTFFGPDAQLAVQGRLPPDGTTQIEALTVRTDELDLTGTLTLAEDGLPEAFDFNGTLRPTRAEGTLLPLTGEPTRLSAAKLLASYDRAEGQAWTLSLDVNGLRRGETRLEIGSLDASGTITHEGSAPGLTASIDAALAGIATGNRELDAALSDRLAAKLALKWTQGGALTVTSAAIDAGPTRLSGYGALRIIDGRPRISGNARFRAPVLGQFAALYGQSLTGAAEGSLKGWFQPLGGAFDLAVDLSTTALDAGQSLPIRLANGDSRFNGGLARTTEGTTARNLQVSTPSLSARLDGAIGTEDGTLTFDATLFDLADLTTAVSGPASLNGTLTRTGETLTLDVSGTGGPQVSLALTGTAAADFATAALNFDASLPDLGALVPALSGPASASGDLSRTAEGLSFNAETALPKGIAAKVSGTSPPDLTTLAADVQAQIADLAAFIPDLPGPATANGTIGYADTITVNLSGAAPLGVEYALNGTIAPDASNADLRLTGTAPLSAAQPFLPGIEAQGTAELDLALQGPIGPASLSGSISGQGWAFALPDAGIAANDVSARFTLDPEAEPDTLVAGTLALTAGSIVAPGQSWEPLIDGPVSAQTRLALAGNTLTAADLKLANGDASFDGNATIPDITAPVIQAKGIARLESLSRLAQLAGLQLAGRAETVLEATYNPATSRLDLKANGITDIRGGTPLDTLLAGPGKFSADLTTGDLGLTFHSLTLATPALSAEASGDLDSLAVTATLDNLGRLVTQLPGPVRAEGTVGVEGQGVRLDLTATGPGNTNVTARGTVGATADLSLNGTAPLGIAKAFIDSVDLDGTARFDLALQGPPALSSLSGTASVSGGRAVVTGASFAMTGIEARANLSGGTAQITATGQGRDGGTISVNGSAGLQGQLPVDLSVQLQNLRYLRAPTLRTSLDGTLTWNGTILGSSTLAGRIDLGETEIALALSTSGGSVDEVAHVGDSAAVRATRARAGLNGPGAAPAASASLPINLDILVSAPRRIFVRGRGLDAELGGDVRITGRIGNIVPIGSFQLIRGRLDILGKRLDLSEGEVLIQGTTDPTIRLVAQTSAEDVAIRIVTEGSAFEPEFNLTSSPQLPEEEILALLLFGKGLSTITPLQALQLAAAVQTLLGSGGEGVVGRIRSGFGLDDLDITADNDGNVAVRAGKYLTENAYADVTVNSQGETELELNLDLTPSITARGSVASDGETGLGIFFERDY